MFSIRFLTLLKASGTFKKILDSLEASGFSNGSWRPLAVLQNSSGV